MEGRGFRSAECSGSGSLPRGIGSLATGRHATTAGCFSTALLQRAEIAIMRIEHVALWTTDLERSRAFYAQHFGATAGPLYRNPRTGFSSYFVSFSDGARLELMVRPDVTDRPAGTPLGFAHFAVSLGSEEEVVRQTAALAAAGITVVGQPRRTGDGYFESVIADPDGNLVELTV